MTYMTNTAAIATAHADYIAQTIEANAAYCKPVSIDYAWSTCETLVDGEWHPIPLVSITWDNGNTVRLDITAFFTAILTEWFASGTGHS